MVVKQTRRPAGKTIAQEPIYFVGLEATPAGQVLITSTQSATQTGPDGFKVTYQQRINGTTGACVCGCKGFQESIAMRAQRDGVTPTVSNGRTCKHIRKAAQSGHEWGYIADEKPVAPIAKVEANTFDWVAHFESLY
jgi:hypothetical protein